MRAASILRRGPRLLLLGALALLLLALLPRLFVHSRRAQASVSHGDSIYRVEKKRFSQTLRLNGTTIAAHSFAVLAPRLEGASVGPVQTGSIGFGDSFSQSFHFTYPSYGASLTLNLPLRRHSAQANLADALVSRSRDKYQERRTSQSITLEVTNAVHSLEQAKLSMEAAKVAVDLAQETLHADERKYELGAETVFFVLDAQTQLTQAEQTLILAQVNYQLAVATLDHATGDLLDHHHVQIVQPTSKF